MLVPKAWGGALSGISVQGAMSVFKIDFETIKQNNVFINVLKIIKLYFD